MNNSVYSFLFDSIINAYLAAFCAKDPKNSHQIGLVIHSEVHFFGPVGFPAVLDLGLRVNTMGKSSVTYEVGVFENGYDDVKAVGEYTHVFVDRESNRPISEGMSDELKKGLVELLPPGRSKL